LLTQSEDRGDGQQKNKEELIESRIEFPLLHYELDGGGLSVGSAGSGNGDGVGLGRSCVAESATAGCEGRKCASDAISSTASVIQRRRRLPGTRHSPITASAEVAKGQREPRVAAVVVVDAV